MTTQADQSGCCQVTGQTDLFVPRLLVNLLGSSVPRQNVEKLQNKSLMETGATWRSLPLKSVSSFLDSADAGPKNIVWSHTFTEENKS